MNRADPDLLPRRPLVIIGAGGHAISVANVAMSIGYEIFCLVDKNKSGSKLLDFNIVSELEQLGDLAQYSFAVAIGANASRCRVQKEVADGRNLHFPALVHASSIVSSFSTVGPGTVVMPLVAIGPNTHIGAFCILNTRASIDHDSCIDACASLAPGVTTGGNVKIGARTAVSLGAVIKHGVTIGADSVLGANSYLSTDLGSNVVAYGTPAKVIRGRSSDDVYLR